MRAKKTRRAFSVNTPPICVDCQRLRQAVYGKWGMFCDAFPEGIPDAIKTSRVDHRLSYPGDHDLQFLAKSPAAALDAARIIADAQSPQPSQTSQRATVGELAGDLALDNDWLYAWGNLPTTLDGLRAWLRQQDIAIADFKNSARYEANYDRFPWLKDL